MLLACCLMATTASRLWADPVIIDWPIRFDNRRVQLTKDYIQEHYGLAVDHIRIQPTVVVIHHTVLKNLKLVHDGFDRTTIHGQRSEIIRNGSGLNVSAHFLVARDGTIFRLMPENRMARHCIGLNYDAIGIENLGGGPHDPLTHEQLAANAELIRYLCRTYPIRFLLGHMEWPRFEHAPFFRERDPEYRTVKTDPGTVFMEKLRAKLTDLNLADRWPAPGGPP